MSKTYSLVATTIALTLFVAATVLVGLFCLPIAEPF
jgi:hypothetical protein